MSVPAPASSTTAAARVVIAGAGPAAQALATQLCRARFTGTITVLSSLDEASTELLDLALMPRVSLRLGQPATFIDTGTRTVTTADGMEFGYDHLVVATGPAPEATPVEGSEHCLGYTTIDDAAGIGDAVVRLTGKPGGSSRMDGGLVVPAAEQVSRCGSAASAGLQPTAVAASGSTRYDKMVI